jgi:hypothetical protein
MPKTVAARIRGETVSVESFGWCRRACRLSSTRPWSTSTRNDRFREAGRAAGFEVRREQRTGGTLMGVLVRTETVDEEEATRVIERHVPDVRKGPPAVPTRVRAGYRENR